MRNRSHRILNGLPWAVFLLGIVIAVVLSWIDSQRVQLAFIASTGVALLALAMFAWNRVRLLDEHGELFTAPLQIANDPQLLEHCKSLTVAIRDVAANKDPIFHELAMDRLGEIQSEVKAIAHGQIAFGGTEAWRLAYERLLRSNGLYFYRSIAKVETKRYWQDEAATRSMEVNFEMADRGLRIERIAIVSDDLWPTNSSLPVERVTTWLRRQVENNIDARLVRRSLIENERELIADIGIYGNRAVGYQELDHQGRTIRFTLSFDFSEVLEAQRRWERLAIHAMQLRS